MIGLDTNVLARYIAQDDTQQSPEATRLIESLTTGEPGFIGVVAVVELVWVLKGCYGATKGEICDVLETLLRTKELVIAQADIVWKALRVYRDGKADFADCLIERTAHASGCRYTATFDQNAARTAAIRLIE